MKRHILFPAAAVVLGAAGCAVRLWERSSAYDPLSGLTTVAAPSAVVLLVLTAAAVAAAFVLARQKHRSFSGGYDEAFYAPNAGYPVLILLSAVALLAAGILAFLTYRADLALFADGYLKTRPPIILPLLTVLAIRSALCLFPIAQNGYRGWGKGKRSALLLAPAFLCCIWLVASYLEESGNPDMMSFVFGRMAAVTVTLALYYVASFSFEKAKPGRLIFFSVTGIFFSFVSLSDTGAWYLKLMSLFSILYLTAQLSALSWNDGEAHFPHSTTPEVTTDEP